jgi:hypothetical protein
VPRREPREARVLGLWTAAWLAVLLLVGLLWLGDLSLQWPVLVVPVLWALVALRPRRRDRDRPRGWEVRPAPTRTDTVEAPAVTDRRDRRDRRGEWG